MNHTATVQLGSFRIDCDKCGRTHTVKAEMRLTGTDITINVETPEDCQGCQGICHDIAEALAHTARAEVQKHAENLGKVDA